MCLYIRPGIDNKEAFLRAGLKRYGKLIMLFKHARRCRDGNYCTPFQNNRIILDTITVSDRDSVDTTIDERAAGIVNYGLHMSTTISSYSIAYNCFIAVVHEDDFVAYDNINHEVVFSRAIYTELDPSEEKLKKFEQMLEAD